MDDYQKNKWKFFWIYIIITWFLNYSKKKKKTKKKTKKTTPCAYEHYCLYKQLYKECNNEPAGVEHNYAAFIY